MLKKLTTFIFSSVLFSFSLSGTVSFENKPDWSQYFEDTIDASSPHSTLVKALQLFEAEGKEGGFAIDLGCGTGRDTLHLLEKGWNVLSLDGEDLAIDILLNRVKQESLERLQVMVSSFSSMLLPDNADLINASFSLPFCPPEDFSSAWEKITESLAPQGRFSGHFFGDRDAWSSIPGRTHHSKDEVKELFKNGFILEHFEEVEDDFPCADGTMKHWHLFFVVAKKI